MRKRMGLKRNQVIREELLDLLKKDAYMRKKVILSSGKESDFYIDVRRVSLSSTGSYLIAHCLWDLIKHDDMSAIGGPTLGADPIVGAVCLVACDHHQDLKGFIIRKSPKKHGQQQLIEGKELTASDKVILIDDVATSGGSLVKALSVMKEHRIEVVKCVAVVDRAEGARETIEATGVPFVSLFSKEDFV